MMKYCLIFLIFISWAFASEKEDEWIYVTKKDGVTVYTKESKNSPVRALRAIGMVDAPVERVITILRDVESAKEWVPNLIERSYIKELSDTELIVYEIADLPWPVSDRDMILHHKITLAKDKKSIMLYFKSVKDESKKTDPDLVRAQFHYGKIMFKPVGEKTQLEMILLVDPLGSVPKWAVNVMQVSMPHNLIMSLNKFAAKSTLKTRPGIAELISQLEPEEALTKETDEAVVQD